MMIHILESSRGASQVDVDAVVRELYGILNSRGRRALQYSFVTKLAHTANSSYPIYDALVARLRIQTDVLR